MSRRDSRIIPHSPGLKEIALICSQSLPISTSNSAILTKTNLRDGTEPTAICCQMALTVEEENQRDKNHDNGSLDHQGILRRERTDYFNFMHKRFGHMGTEQLRICTNLPSSASL
ncbi:hypothetical protein K3495_g7703 [Podosphaera aphanis]|nr:hypothetical protein K3495_g7703 [Podosphaera aphanis]